jgi:hypothetical protein
MVVDSNSQVESHLDHLLGCVDWIDFQHEQIKNQISDEGNLLLAIVDDGKHRGWIFRIVENVDFRLVEC